MSDNIIHLNEELIKSDLKDLVRSSVEETLNALLDKEADELINAQRYERSADRQGRGQGQSHDHRMGFRRCGMGQAHFHRLCPEKPLYQNAFRSKSGVYREHSPGSDSQGDPKHLRQ